MPSNDGIRLITFQAEEKRTTSDSQEVGRENIRKGREAVQETHRAACGGEKAKKKHSPISFCEAPKSCCQGSPRICSSQPLNFSPCLKRTTSEKCQAYEEGTPSQSYPHLEQAQVTETYFCSCGQGKQHDGPFEYLLRQQMDGQTRRSLHSVDQRAYPKKSVSTGTDSRI